MRDLIINKSITNGREVGTVLNIYLEELRKVSKTISADEEVLLAQRFKGGDLGALEKLIKANLFFVVSVAKQYQNRGLELPDLISFGNIGLIRAAKRFDETRGFKFISYAVWWIRQEILIALEAHSRVIKLTPNIYDDIEKVRIATIQLQTILSRDPHLIEIA